MFNFEKLDVWRKSVDFAHLVYRLTQDFPTEERFGITNQMRRASVSISSNIAEGSSRSSRVEYSRFVELAAGSLFEVVSQAHIALRQAYLNDESFRLLHSSAEELSRMLSGLKSYLGKASNG
ncbi:MAG TPA: four helix bundle protein [Terrimicrobiaceae bacterium]